MSAYFILAFFTYFSLLLGLGLVFHKRQTSSADFMMGNRSLSFWLVALSAHASDMSAWLFMAFPMTIFVLGLGQVWIALGLVTGMFLNWHFVAPRLRSMTEKYECYTLSSFFEKRFEDTSGTLKLLSALVMVIFLTHYLSAGLIAMGILLESLFGIGYMIGLSVTLCVVVLYTFMGGFTTVAWTDLFQGIFLLFVIILVPFIAFSHIEGWSSIQQIAAHKQISLSFIPADTNVWSILDLILLALGWGLGYFGMPHVITKFMGIKDVSEMSKSKWLGMSWQLTALGAAAVIGLIGIAFFPEGLEQPELVFVEMVKILFHPFLAGLILCAVIAANLSTMDSQILVCASIISEDLYRSFRKASSDAKILWVSRLSVIFISIIALALASNKSASILDTVLYSWSGLGSAFGPLVLMSLYSEKTNRIGAIAGIIAGTLTVIAWPTFNASFLAVKVPPLIPGFFLSLAAIYIFSKLSLRKEKHLNG